MNKEIKIAIGLPTNRLIKPKTVLSLANLINETKYDVFPIVASEGFTIAENRIYITVQAIKNGCTHLFFVDDDMTFPADTLDRLMEHKKEVIGVNLYSRCLPLRSTIIFLPESYNLDGESFDPIIPDHIFEVEGCTGGCLLIDLSIIDKLEKPWYGFEVNEFGVTLLGEDVWFTRRARKAGYKVWCDPTIVVGHIGDMNFSSDNTLINNIK
jgi:GT2 family glycosyltransferase